MRSWPMDAQTRALDLHSQMNCNKKIHCKLRLQKLGRAHSLREMGHQRADRDRRHCFNEMEDTEMAQ